MTEEMSIIGYVIVDRVSKAIDWDGDIHATTEQAIQSLTGPLHMYCVTLEEESDEKTHWAAHYMLCAVTDEVVVVTE